LLPITAQQSFSTIGSNFIELNVVDSTNSYAIDKVQANLAAHGAAFFAHEQTAGKGQHGKTWLSNAGDNIIVSCVIDCSFLSIHQQFYMSVCVATACYDFFYTYAGEETSIKWPNDIYWRDRKAGGILIENIVRGNDWKYCIAGIGININQTEFDVFAKKPVSLKQITGKHFNSVSLAKELCLCLDRRFNELLQGKHSEQLAFYNHILFKKNQLVQLKKGSVRFTCEIVGVNNLGALLVKNGPQESFHFGEIEWIL